MMETDNDGVEVGFKWVRKNSSSPNHFFDCHVYNVGVKEIVTDLICRQAKLKHASWSDFVEIVKSSYL